MRYHNITTADMMNGEGLRVVLWLSGCTHHCYNCQNPITWDENDGLVFDKSAKEELFRELGKDYISGLTLSGGDPLHEANLDGVLELVNKIRLSSPNKSIWIYTGYTWNEIFKNDSSIQAYYMYDYMGNDFINNEKRKQIVSQCSIMVDGRYVDSQRNPSKKWAGSDNQRVIDIKQSLQKGEVILWTD